MKTKNVGIGKPAGIVLLCGALWSSQALSAEFIFLNLMGNTLPPAKCQSAEVAASHASSEYELARYAKVFCETQGYGWHVDQRKSNGTTVCVDCKDSPDKQQCHVEDIQVTCKRLKPGSAGLIPGRG
jgi:hypothetical protein